MRQCWYWRWWWCQYAELGSTRWILPRTPQVVIRNFPVLSDSLSVSHSDPSPTLHIYRQYRDITQYSSNGARIPTYSCAQLWQKGKRRGQVPSSMRVCLCVCACVCAYVRDRVRQRLFRQRLRSDHVFICLQMPLPCKKFHPDKFTACTFQWI